MERRPCLDLKVTKCFYSPMSPATPYLNGQKKKGKKFISLPPVTPVQKQRGGEMGSNGLITDKDGHLDTVSAWQQANGKDGCTIR